MRGVKRTVLRTVLNFDLALVNRMLVYERVDRVGRDSGNLEVWRVEELRFSLIRKVTGKWKIRVQLAMQLQFEG